MKNFNTERFKAYAQYDLNANKSFYRNVGISILLVAIGMMLFQVMVKWAITGPGKMDYQAWNYQPDSFNLSSITSYILMGFYAWAGSIGMNILAGSWAHNMRKKQGRINMLTLPVSSLEKYVWHTLLMIAGGFLTILGSIIAADVLNVLLSWMATGAFDMHFSTLYAATDLCNFLWKTITQNTDPRVCATIATLIIIAGWSWQLVETMIFVLSNSVKFKYNVIITYAILIIANSILTTIFQISMLNSSFLQSFEKMMNLITDTGNPSSTFAFCAFMTVIIIVLLSAAAGIYYAGYRLFQKSQICDKWNK